jgi:FkbM family methyltransferase
MFSVLKSRFKLLLLVAGTDPRLFLLKLVRATESRILSRFLNGTAEKEINGIRFDFDFELDHNIREMYVGNYEVEAVDCIKKLLKERDVFIDVGANIGYLSAVAAGCVGKEGEVHSFEPVPEYFQKLKEMADKNPAYKIRVNQCALADKPGAMRIAVSKVNVGNNSMVLGLIDEKKQKDHISVSVCTLAQYIEQRKINRISMIKIDVEGFEFPVLKGLQPFFKTAAKRPPILCEIMPEAYPLLGYSLEQLADYMENWSYDSFSLKGNQGLIDIRDIKEFEGANVLFWPRGRHMETAR